MRSRRKSKKLLKKRRRKNSNSNLSILGIARLAGTTTILT